MAVAAGDHNLIHCLSIGLIWHTCKEYRKPTDVSPWHLLPIRTVLPLGWGALWGENPLLH